MRVIMFQPRFARKVESLEKTQTIRAKARCVPGDILSLREWTGKAYRSKQRVIRQVICTKVENIGIWRTGFSINLKSVGQKREDRDKLARADGFNDWEEMVEWFEQTNGLTFSGQLISWEA